MNITFYKILLPIIAIFFFLPVNNLHAAPVKIYDQIKGGAEKAINQAYGGGKTVTEKDFAEALIDIINAMLNFLAIIFMLVILYAGYLWMTARGNEDQVDRAKKILREAAIGIIVVFCARIITELVLTYIGNATAAQEAAAATE